MKRQKPEVIIIIGAPGVGKTTTAKILAKQLKAIMLRLSWLRALHLDPKWKNASLREANMTYRTLVFMTKNYLRHKFHPIVIEDILSTHAQRLKRDFRGTPYFIVNLVMSDNAMQKKRVLTATRDSGYRKWKDASEINRFYRRRTSGAREVKIDTTHTSPVKVVQYIVRALNQKK